MAEEFDEAEVVFSDDFNSIQQSEDDNDNRLFGLNNTRRIKRTEKTSLSSSLPVNVKRRFVEKEVEEYSDGGVKLVPPHIVVGRRIQGGQMAFSVCTGSGRTLKGRDLSRVRNSVLKITGFLEA